MDTDDEPLYVENCKHSGEDVLIVQRNNGIRWVTCTDCGADFVRSEFHDHLRSEVKRLRDGIEWLTESYQPPEVTQVVLLGLLNGAA